MRFLVRPWAMLSVTVLLALGVGGWLGRCGRRRGLIATTALQDRAVRVVAASAVGGLPLVAGLPLVRHAPHLPAWLAAWATELAMPVIVAVVVAGAVAVGVLEWPARADAARGRAIGHIALAAALFVGLVAWQGRPVVVRAPSHVDQGVVLQTTDETCGPSALATLLRATGVVPSATEAMLARVAGTTVRGTGVPGEQWALAHYGVASTFRRGLRADDLLAMTHPAVLHVRVAVGQSQLDHAVALLGVDRVGRRVVIGDPVRGLAWQSVDALDRGQWYGELVQLDGVTFAAMRAAPVPRSP
jgi:hypothetical protein